MRRRERRGLPNALREGLLGQGEAALARVLADVLACEPAALATVKRLVLSVNDEPDVAVMDDAADSLAALLRQPAARAGIDAFMAKRRPPWAG